MKFKAWSSIPSEIYTNWYFGITWFSTQNKWLNHEVAGNQLEFKVRPGQERNKTCRSTLLLLNEHCEWSIPGILHPTCQSGVLKVFFW